MNKLLKYRVLRHLPGQRGRRYERKFMGLVAKTIEFDEAIRCSKGMTCIDLGANVGKYTRRMSVGTKQVIAFEPDPWAYESLLANIADLNNVRVENAAVATSDGKVLLYRHARFSDNPAFYSESSSIIASKNNVIEEGAIKVRQIDFIRYLEELDSDIGILKIDVEGAEVDLLEALFDRPEILRRIDHIFAETHETRIPHHERRVDALRKKAKLMKHPRINPYWN